MAETIAAPNNVAVKYRGKPERERSKAPDKVTRRARRAMKQGLISPKAAKRYLKGS